MSVQIRPMAQADVVLVAALETAIFSAPWSDGMFSDELVAPDRAWFVALDEAGAVVAYAGVAVFAGGDAHLMNIAVSPARRRQGLGGRLLAALTDAARSMSADRLTLEVSTDNAAATQLYAGAGFESAGVRPGYYGPGGDAVIMWADLPQVARKPETSVSPAVAAGGTDDLILAIESSCDETAAAVMRGGRELLANIVATQIDFHARFGGVVPEIASRKHTEAIVGVVDEAMARAGEALGIGRPLAFDALDAIAVTQAPGLIGALVVGLAYAKGLAFATGKPLVGVNHLEGHIFANVFADPAVEPPLVALLVSGGHTSLVHMPEWGIYHTLGETLDDAAGEAFDKVAKVLGLGYPGGPILSKLAEKGDAAAIDFPRAMMKSGDYAFSLSGLKTAVLTHIRHEEAAGRRIDVPDLAASFQQAVIDVQVSKAVRAVKETGAKTFCLGGGVAANKALRRALTKAIEPLGVHVSVPPMELCTDNAAMIAAAAHYRFLRGEHLGLDAEPSANEALDTI